MTDTSPVGAIVLAGGRSSRFGRDKLAEPIDGRPMLDLAIQAVRPLAADVVVVVAPGALHRTASNGVRVVEDATAHEGPLAGLATGLRALDPMVDRAVVVGGDMPTIVPSVLARLLVELAHAELAVLDDGERPRPLPLAARTVVVRTAAQQLLERGERRLRALFDEVEMVVIPLPAWRVDDPTGSTLLDVDVPDDLPG